MFKSNSFSEAGTLTLSAVQSIDALEFGKHTLI